ncbi:MAG: rhamnulokinase [Solirubrobacterales bacterium]|nr:rhamnulokinase [Solirubrobacterales bacterium]
MEFAAIDLGASSGRVHLGRLADGVLTLEEAHRFPNRPVRLPDGLHWDLLHLYREAVEALRGRTLAGVGVDSWAVDYALLDEQGRLLGLPFHYRDDRTRDMMAGFPREEAYAVTAIQTMPINTVFQLLAERDSPALRSADRIALIPDLIAHWLSGELVNERTNASTTGLLDARTGEWSQELIARLGLPARPFGALVDPGTALGTVRDHHGIDAAVFAVASHDTASAFVGTPLTDRRSAILSSGTWSLLGLELTGPVFSDAELSNERGVDGTIRLLKNVMGLWLEQECARAWGASAEDLQAEAATARADVPLFDPDRKELLAPGDMPARVAAACGERNLGHGEMIRSIYLSLACRYRTVLERLERAAGRDVRAIHVIGGGARNALLCQLTADLCEREVRAGPTEAAAVGNLLVQARAAGELASLDDMRAVSAASVRPSVHEPSWAAEQVQEALGRFATAQATPLGAHA